MGFSTTFANLPDGLQLLSLWDQALAEAGNGVIAEPAQITAASGTVSAGTRRVAIVRVSPTATTVILPSVAAQDGVPLTIFDWSSGVTGHTITITPHGTDTIMLLPSFPLYSNASSLASVTLYPSTDLSGWNY